MHHWRAERENGQAIPELYGLIQLSELYGISIDRIVKDNEECNINLFGKSDSKIHEITQFLIRAKQNTYVCGDHKVPSIRCNSHDYEYIEDAFTYYDTFLGNECFSGEEAVWIHEQPVWCMNYTGRVLGEPFQSSFLKEALSMVSTPYPYRGPSIYTKGDYHYHCKIEGEFIWFQGYEEIFYQEERIYECYFHGGTVK